MLTFNPDQFRTLSAATRARWRAEYAVWLIEDFPSQAVAPAADIARWLDEIFDAAREIGAVTMIDIYRVIALRVVPPVIADSPSLAGAIGRTLIDVDVGLADRLRFIERLIVAQAPWPPADRFAALVG